MTSINVKTVLDRKTFKDFAYFNNYLAFHHWIGYTAFPVIILILACIALFTGRKPIFFVFLAMAVIDILWNAVIYPIVLNRQISQRSDDEEKTAYTLTLNDNGIYVKNDTEKAEYPWSRVFHVYAFKNCIYLYMLKTRCFVLPEKDFQDGATMADLKKMLQRCLPKNKLPKLE